MILVDTSIWIDHLADADVELSRLLADGRVLMHPYVMGELALGQWPGRKPTLKMLRRLPAANVATAAETLALIEGQGLAGSGIGYVDAHLIASTRLTHEARLWTRDRRLQAVAQRLGVSHDGLH